MSSAISFFENCDYHRIKIAQIFKDAVLKDNFQKFADHVKGHLYPGCEADVRNVVDQAVRDCLRALILDLQSVEVKLELGHRAHLREKPSPEGFTHDWTVFIKGLSSGADANNIQHFVDHVVFHLHESYPKPKRVVKEPPYQVSESGYTGFCMPVEVYFRSKEEPKKVSFEYDVFVNTDSTPVSNIRCEKLTFYNPAEDFRRKLIKAGGVLSVATDLLERILSFSIEAALQDLCTVSLPVLVLSDMFDCSTLEECEAIFTFIEDRVDVLKKDIFFKTCKNQLLRSCNDLLRRLSRSQNTVFCGRILLFLARIFPLSERSGLNIISEFNLDNATVFSSKDDSFNDLSLEKEEPMEEGEISTRHPIVIDYNLYRKFWSLQDYFRQPNMCYNKMYWRHFTSYSSDILGAFSSFKLDNSNAPKWKLSEGCSVSEKPMYFAKYLTSPKLLELELSDSNFRRYVLTQFLILFQYLSSPVRFKLESYQLSDDQQAWIKEATEKVYKLLEETPPGGEEFSRDGAKILKREEYWNAWKNEGCPDFKNVEDKMDLKPIKKKRRLGDDIWEAQVNKRVLVGNAELNRLWNLCPDNWESCGSPKRDFVPSLDKFFEAAIEEADPANQIENQYKKVYDSNYSWRALRLLSQKSPHFFTHSNQPSKNLPCYLESMVMKLAKERPVNQMQPEQVEIKAEVSSDAGDTAVDTDDDLLQNTEENEIREDKSRKGSKHVVTKGTLELLAEKLQGKWKTLAPKLGFQDDEIYYYESEFSDASNQGRQMLTVWMEQDVDGGSFATLRTALQKAGLLNLAFPVLQGMENAGRTAKN